MAWCTNTSLLAVLGHIDTGEFYCRMLRYASHRPWARRSHAIDQVADGWRQYSEHTRVFGWFEGRGFRLLLAAIPVPTRHAAHLPSQPVMERPKPWEARLEDRGASALYTFQMDEETAGLA